MTPATLTFRQVAEMIGMARDTLRRRLPLMRQEGFPVPDRILGRYLTADVEAWLERRRQVTQGEASINQEVNHDAL